MKSFVAGVIIILTVVVLISVNAFFSAYLTDKLLLSLDTLKKEQSVTAYNAFAKQWEKHSTYFYLTVARSHIQTFESGMNLVSYSLTSGASDSFVIGISRIERAIVAIGNFSSLNFTDIF